MKSIATLGVWLALVSVSAAQEVPRIPVTPQAPGAPPVTWGGEIDFSSRYVWRGQPYSSGRVVWPSAFVTVLGVTTTLWVNYDQYYTPELNEYDLSVAFTRPVEKLTLTASYQRYRYFDGSTDSSTTEVIARAAYPVGPGSVFTSHAWDIGDYLGAYYVEAGYSFARDFNARSSLAIDGSVAFWSKFAEKYTGVPGSTWGPVTLNVMFTRKIAPHVLIRPHATFGRILDADMQKLLAPPAVTAGAALMVKF